MKIKDVIYGEIDIQEDIINDLIQTPEFQRLRKIKQLGVTNLTFPGAEHNRLTHSVGVYNLIKKILLKFELENKRFYTDSERISILCAGLLHDLGHGPLSHTAELFFGYSHENYTIKIIENREGGIYKILKKYEQSLNFTIIENIVALINKKHKNKALNSLISSSLDADRMDYLMRDSYYTGAVYGRIDSDRIIDALEYKNGEIVFLEKALHTIEDFIMSRYHMFVQVYLNDKSLFYEELLQKILKRVFLLYDKDYQFKTDISMLLDLTEQPIPVTEYIKINDYNFLSLISDLIIEEDEELQKLLEIYEAQNLFEITKQTSQIKDNDKVFLKTFKIRKTVYTDDEAIKILQSNGKVVNIEELSPLFMFVKNELKIENEETYLILNEKL